MFRNHRPTILLAGSTGTIGRSLLEALKKKQVNIICPIRGNEKKETLEIRKNTACICTLPVNISMYESLEGALKQFSKIDIVISCIGTRVGTIKDAKEAELNVNSNLLRIAENKKSNQFILLSAICVQKPKLKFQKFKLQFEELLKKSEINHTIIRPTAFFKSLSGQISRIRKGKRFIVFDKGVGTAFKPISENDLCSFIIEKILDNNCYGKTFLIGGPGPAINQKEQGRLIFRGANMPEKYVSIPTIIFKLMIFFLYPGTLFSEKIRDLQEFFKIALFYGTESMLVWDKALSAYSDEETPEFGTETLENHFKTIFANQKTNFEVSDKKLFY